MPSATIQLDIIKNVPPYADPLIRAIGLAYLKFGRIEQHMDFLLQSVNDARFVTGEIPRYPDTSFRLRCALFKKIYAQHPHFAIVHHIAGPVFIGLKKANKSRNRLVHSNIQGFAPGPPPSILAIIAKFNGRDLRTWNGNWTLAEIEEYGVLLDHLSDDLGKISHLTMNDAFRQSLEKDLSRTERVILWFRDRLRRLPRLRIERPNSPI